MFLTRTAGLEPAQHLHVGWVSNPLRYRLRHVRRTPGYTEVIINIEKLHLENHPGAAQQLTNVTSGENSGLRTIAITEIVLSP